MALLKAYEWEGTKWPWHRKLNIGPEIRRGLTLKLARFFGLIVYVRLNSRGGGSAERGGEISLPAPRHDCSLGLILHELAHVLDGQKFGGGSGHTGSFKRALIKVYIEANRSVLCRLLRECKADVTVEAVRARQHAEREERAAARRVEAKAKRWAPEARLEQARARVKRLRSRVKRLTTLLRSAERSLSARERAQDRHKQSQVGIRPHVLSSKGHRFLSLGDEHDKN